MSVLFRNPLRFARVLLAAALGAVSARAHLEPGSLSSPKAGQAYAAGSEVRITWVQAEYHSGKYGLHLSRNSGETWDLIEAWEGPSGNGVTVNYAWTVPDAVGTKARVRVCQIGECGDPDYMLMTGDFAIVPAAPVRPAAGSATAAPLAFRNGRLEASFTLERSAPVELAAYGLSGARLETVLMGTFAPGGHRIALPIRALQPGSILALRMGSRTWARLLLPSP
jgi:hypothetical protein